MKKSADRWRALTPKKAKLDAIKQRVDGLDKQLQDKLAALTQTISSEKDLKKNEAKDKLQDKLKDKFGF